MSSFVRSTCQHILQRDSCWFLIVLILIRRNDCERHFWDIQLVDNNIDNYFVNINLKIVIFRLFFKFEKLFTKDYFSLNDYNNYKTFKKF